MQALFKSAPRSWLESNWSTCFDTLSNGLDWCTDNSSCQATFSNKTWRGCWLYTPGRIASTCSTTDDTFESIPANAIQKSSEEKLLALVEKLDQRLNVIEDRMTTSRPAYNRRPRPPQQSSGPPKEVVCFKCCQVGHYARGCVATKPQNQGN